MSLRYELNPMSIDDLLLKYTSKRINTSPAFQRKTAWRSKDRLRLIKSILVNHPIPSIFLYKRDDGNGNIIYDVIDGKQRIETIIKYYDARYFKNIESVEGRFLQDSEYYQVVSYKQLEPQDRTQFSNYKIATIEVSGEYADILDLFIKINTLGAPLKKSEIRNAKYIQGPWIKYINEILKNKNKNSKLLLINEMFKKNRTVDRMSKEEFILELLITFFTETVNDGKTILDKVLSESTSSLSTKKKNDFLRLFDWINKIFSIKDIRETRLKYKSDFYSIFSILNQYFKKGIVTNDNKTNKMIREIVCKFFYDVDSYLQKPKKKSNQWIIDYSNTISSGTDKKQHRIERNTIIEQLLCNIPHKTRDKDRTFSDLQKRLLWNKIRDNPICPGEKCGGVLLTWEDITIDHIQSWINGGRTTLDNGQILCRKCNSSKGSRK